MVVLSFRLKGEILNFHTVARHLSEPVLSAVEGFEVTVKKPPSPLRGEGRGEGDVKSITGCHNPPPLNPLPQGEGKMTFYDAIKVQGFKVDEVVKSRHTGCETVS